MPLIIRLAWMLALVLGACVAQAQNKVPSERVLETLVKASLLTFNDANVTGNYAVLHAKLSKPFRDQFPVERLEETYKEFNRKRVDFDIVAALRPTYDPPPHVDDDGRLLVKGYFPTEPRHVYFDLGFIPSDGEWKLLKLNVKVDSPP